MNETGTRSPRGQTSFNEMHKDWVAILDFGSKYVQLIARRIRECGIYSEILPYNIKTRRLLTKAPKAIILSGGPARVTLKRAPVCNKNIFKNFLFNIVRCKPA